MCRIFNCVATVLLVFVAFSNDLSAESKPGTLKVGALLSLSWGGAYMGEDMRDALLLCKNDSLSIVFDDHQSQATVGLSAFNKMVDVDGVNFGIVTFSNVSSAVIPVALKKKVPLLLSIVSAAAVAARGGESVVNFFSTGEQESKVIGEYLTHTLGIKKIAILYMESEFGLSYTKGLESAMQSGGGAVVAKAAFNFGTHDFRAELLKLKSSGPELIYVVAFDTDIITAFKQLKDSGYTGRLASVWTTTAPAMINGNEMVLEGVLTTTPEFYLGKGAKLEEFKKRFLERYGRAASAYAGLGCDIASILSPFAGSEPTAVLKALRSLKGFEGVLGELSFDPALGIQIPLIPAEIRGGKVLAK